MRGREREQCRPALLGDELARDRAVLGARLTCFPRKERECVVRTDGVVEAATALDAGREPAVAEAGLEPPPHRNSPGDGFDLAHELALRRQALVCEQQGVGHAHRPARGLEGGDEHVRALLVGALGLERLVRRELEEAAATAVEDPGEHRGRIDVREAEPVDRAVGGNEGCRPTVADHRVLPDRRVAGEPLHVRQCSQARRLACRWT